jgi:hypothetical protein
MRNLLLGALACGFLVAALHFLRFWRATGDRLFGLFAAAFALMAVNAVLLELTDDAEEARVFVYGVRLVAFLLILLAIGDKNRTGRRGS